MVIITIHFGIVKMFVVQYVDAGDCYFFVVATMYGLFSAFLYLIFAFPSSLPSCYPFVVVLNLCSFIHEAQTSPQTDSVQTPTATHKDSTAQQQKFTNYNPINNPQKQRTSNRNNYNQNQHANYTMDTSSKQQQMDNMMAMMKEMQRSTKEIQKSHKTMQQNINTLSQRQNKNSNPQHPHIVQRTH